MAFASAKRVRSFDDVTSQIRQAILSGEISQGERLPSERELVEAFEVSRGTLREALRSLEAMGLLEIRLGAHGGAFAVAPDPQLVGDALASLLMLENAPLDDLLEYRLSFEVENARLAAERLDGGDRARLSALSQTARSLGGQEDWEAMERVDLELHHAVALATHNAVRRAIMQAIHHTLDRLFRQLSPVDGYHENLRDHVVSLVGHLLAGDSVVAAAQMQEHLEQWAEITRHHATNAGDTV